MALNRKIAVIDLDRRIVDAFPVSADCRHRFLGGRGLGAYLLCKHLPRKHPSHGTETVCVISAGLLGGTLSAPQGYTIVMAGSPVNGLVTRACLNGPFSTEIRQAGFDHLIIKGRAKKPVYFYLYNGDIEIRDARPDSGKKPVASRNAIQDETAGKETRILYIHMSGKDRGQVADISSRFFSDEDHHGMGTVLGAKNIKAIACRGTLDIEAKDPEGIIACEKKRMIHDASERNLSSQSGQDIVTGAAGRVTLGEIKNTVAQCLGLPYGNGTDADRSVFETAPDRIRYNTGLDLSEGDLRDIAYRCITLEHLYNLKMGRGEKSDPLAALYRKNGWTRTAVIKKGKVFDRLGIGDLWAYLK